MPFGECADISCPDARFRNSGGKSRAKLRGDSRRPQLSGGVQLSECLTCSPRIPSVRNRSAAPLEAAANACDDHHVLISYCVTAFKYR
jgi:hypothetical protein